MVGKVSIRIIGKATPIPAISVVNDMEQRAREGGQTLHPNLVERRALAAIETMDSAEEALEIQ